MLRNFAHQGYTIHFHSLDYRQVNDSVYYVKPKGSGGTIEILNESDSTEVVSFNLSVVTKFVIPDIKFKLGYRVLELGTMVSPKTDSFYCESSILKGHDFEELYYRITSYHFSIYREGTCIYTTFNEGNRLSEPVKQAIGQARYKDRFILTDIKVTDNYGNLFTIPEYRAMCCY
ncbi:GldM family protein [Edaphocola aurantiacus]|uniref:GldM family protein n=1 Tax=Edaphocola aurantiacus TaxID=2601682 RepID=UPI001C95B1D0|nr:GldM family protein [Edaphocola aurantiacus]